MRKMVLATMIVLVGILFYTQARADAVVSPPVPDIGVSANQYRCVYFQSDPLYVSQIPEGDNAFYVSFSITSGNCDICDLTDASLWVYYYSGYYVYVLVGGLEIKGISGGVDAIDVEFGTFNYYYPVYHPFDSGRFTVGVVEGMFVNYCSGERQTEAPVCAKGEVTSDKAFVARLVNPFVEQGVTVNTSLDVFTFDNAVQTTDMALAWVPSIVACESKPIIYVLPEAEEEAEDYFGEDAVIVVVGWGGGTVGYDYPTYPSCYTDYLEVSIPVADVLIVRLDNAFGHELGRIPPFFPAPTGGEYNPIIRRTDPVDLWPHLTLPSEISPYEVECISVIGMIKGRPIDGCELFETTPDSLEFISEDEKVTVVLSADVYNLTDESRDELDISVRAVIDDWDSGTLTAVVKEFEESSTIFERYAHDIELTLSGEFDPLVADTVEIIHMGGETEFPLGYTLTETTADSLSFTDGEGALVSLSNIMVGDVPGIFQIDATFTLPGRGLEAVPISLIKTSETELIFENSYEEGQIELPLREVSEICQNKVTIIDSAVPLGTNMLEVEIYSSVERKTICAVRKDGALFQSDVFIIIPESRVDGEIPEGFTTLLFSPPDEIGAFYQEKEKKKKDSGGAFFGMYYGKKHAGKMGLTENKVGVKKFKATHTGLLSVVVEYNLGLKGECADYLETKDIKDKADGKEIWYSMSHGKENQKAWSTSEVDFKFRGIELKDNKCYTPADLRGAGIKLDKYKLVFINSCKSATSEPEGQGADDFRNTFFGAKKGECAYIGWKTALGADATTYAVEFANYFFAKLKDEVPVSTAVTDAFTLLRKQYKIVVGTGEPDYPAWIKGYEDSIQVLGNSGLSFDKKEE